jgi:iron complex outermembrane receptor protein
MHREVSIGVVAGCTLAFAPVAHASAQHQAAVARDSIPGGELDELVVTSAPADPALNRTAKLTTVITREEIARQPALSIQDLLKNVVGLDVRQRGPNGVLSDVALRGGTFDQIAVLLNGANLSNPQTGHYSLDLPVNLSDIERIEIIRGPASLLYGAGAFSGGLNIVTKKDTEANVFLKAETGMYALRGAEARGAFQTPSSTHSLSAGYGAADGYLPDSDYRLLNLFWQSRFRTGHATVDWQFGCNDKAYGANTFYSPLYPNQFDDTQSLFASVKGESGTRLKLIPHLYWNRHSDRFHLYRNGTPGIPGWYTGPNVHRSEVFGFNLDLQYQWTGGVTRLGGEIRNEGILSNNLGKRMPQPIGEFTRSDHRTSVAYALEHAYTARKFSLGAGVLLHYNTAYGNDARLYPNLSAGYWLTRHLRVFASWSNAVRMPTFTDLYYVDPAQEGFPDLLPETSEAFDAGCKYVGAFGSFSLNGFYERGKNLIDWVKENPQDKLKAANLTFVNKIGWEVDVSFPAGKYLPCLADTRLHVGYLFMHQDRDAGKLISNYVLDYLRHKLVAGVAHPLGKGLRADWQFRWQRREGTFSRLAGRNDDGAGILEETAFPAFSLVDLKLSYSLNRLSFYLTVNNLFNVAYYDRGNLPQPGIWVSGGVCWAAALP